jgi:hypothetical protein
MTKFYCLKFETPPTWGTRSLYLYPPGVGWPGYTSRHWVPFSSSPTTRRATVEVFDPASTHEKNVGRFTILQIILGRLHANLRSQSQSQNFVTTDGQSVSLSWCQAPIWDLRPIFFPHSVWQLRVCWCGAPSLTRGRSVICQSQSAVVSLLSVCTIYILHVIKRMYVYMYVCINVCT